MTGRVGRGDEHEQRRADLDIRDEEARVAMLEAEADMLGEVVITEQANRQLRNAVAIAALILMALQVLAANGIFAWYGLTAGWDVPTSAVTAWMGTTVIEVVSVVLVIVNYLFPVERRKYA
ncbi:MAG TPA: hypothetical protein VJ204_03015 [Solirubrobacterales bacterium]|nr:hypothetical protein [Solirubrobacterales bacterium]